MLKTQTLLSREAWGTALKLAIPAALVHYFVNGWVALPLWLLALLVGFLFRSPRRDIPATPLGIVAPVDGRVSAVEAGHDRYLDRDAQCIVIDSAWYDVFTVRSPIEGRVEQQWLPAGLKWTETSEFANWIRTDEGDDIVLVVRPRMPVLPAQCLAGIGERVGQGQRCGVMRFGGAVEIWTPRNARIQVHAGDRIVAGSGLLGQLVHG